MLSSDTSFLRLCTWVGNQNYSSVSKSLNSSGKEWNVLFLTNFISNSKVFPWIRKWQSLKERRHYDTLLLKNVCPWKKHCFLLTLQLALSVFVFFPPRWKAGQSLILQINFYFSVSPMGQRMTRSALRVLFYEIQIFTVVQVLPIKRLFGEVDLSQSFIFFHCNMSYWAIWFDNGSIVALKSLEITYLSSITETN